MPVLTAIVVNALIGATEFGIARRLWRVNRVELGIFTGAFFGVLLLGAIKGVLVGMVLSFIDVLMRAAAPQRTFLGTLPGKAGFFPIDRVSGVQALPHIVLYRFSGSLFFANIRRFQEDIEGAVQPDTQAVIVDGSAIVSVDITACDRLVVLNRKLRAQGVRFYLTEHIGEVNDQLRHFEAGELIESGVVRRTIQGALRDADAAVDIGGAQQRIPDNMDDIRQLQELEWLYGADAEVQIERNVQLLLARMRTTEDKDARRTMLEHFLNEDFHFGSIDTDEVLLHLEGHTDELAVLLGNSEDDVFTDLEVERDSLIDRVEQEHPEFVEHVRERRDHLDHDFRANHPTSAARIEARRTQLHARIEHERARTQRSPRPASGGAVRAARRAHGRASGAARAARHRAAAAPASSSSRRACAVRRRSRWRGEQRQAAELARKAQHAAEKAQRHAQHAAGARSGRPIIWQKKRSATPTMRTSVRSAMPSARMPAATARTTGTGAHGSGIRKETGRGGCSFRFLLCVPSQGGVSRCKGKAARRFAPRRRGCRYAAGTKLSVSIPQSA
ncbi:MAG: STAS domain-containing protein [Oscillospiraceae bacterium]